MWARRTGPTRGDVAQIVNALITAWVSIGWVLTCGVCHVGRGFELALHPAGALALRITNRAVRVMEVHSDPAAPPPQVKYHGPDDEQQ